MYNGMKVLAVSMRKGGVGKTLIAVLLAQYFGHFAKRNYRVLFLDVDSQQNATVALLGMDDGAGEARHRTLPLHPSYDPENPEPEDWDGYCSSAEIFLVEPEYQYIVPYPTRFERLDILPALGPALISAELVQSDEVQNIIIDRFGKFLNDPDVQESYDLIIIDTPPSEGPINQAILRHASHVLFPVLPEPDAYNGLVSMLQFERLERRFRREPIEIVGIVPNRVKENTNIHRDYLAMLKQNPITSPLLSDFYIRDRTAFPTIRKPGIKPDNIWEFKRYPDAKHEVEQLCNLVEQRLFGEEV